MQHWGRAAVGAGARCGHACPPSPARPAPCWHSIRVCSRSGRRACAAAAAAAAAAASATLGGTSAPRAPAPVRPISPPPTPLEPSTGFVINEAHLDKVAPAWHGLLASLAATYQDLCGARLVGVYLRGSLPKGHFVPGISDVDSYALLLSPPSGQAAADPVGTAAAAAAGSGGPGHDGNGSSSNDSSNSSDSSSGSSGLSPGGDVVQLQQALRQAIEPLVQQHRQLGFTKVEVKLLQLQPGATTSRLAAHMQQQQQGCSFAAPACTSGSAASSSSSSTSTTSGSSSNSGGGGGGGGDGSLLRLSPAAASGLPCAFELKTQSVTLCGLDLPRLLPPCAALPPPTDLMPSLADDVAAARRAGAAAGASLKLQVSAARWSLKRLLRAAFELVQPLTGVYTRDLYWCCQLAQQHLPQLQQQLAWPPPPHGPHQQQQQQQQQQLAWVQELSHALQLYVDLQTSAAQLQQQPLSPPPPSPPQQQQQQQQQQALVAAAWAVVDVLLPRLETVFLKQMITPDPGWLQHHHGGPIPANTPDTPQPRQQQQQQQPPRQQQEYQQRQQQQPWPGVSRSLQELVGRWVGTAHPQPPPAPAAAPAAAAAAAGQAAEPQQLVGARPPAVHVPVWGQVCSYDWERDRAAGAAAVRQILLGQGGGVVGGAAVQQQPQQQHAATAAGAQQQQQLLRAELFGCAPQPVVLRGAARSWPCVAHQPCQPSQPSGEAAASADEPWTLGWLARQAGVVGRVRVAPSLAFPFVEPALLEVLLRLRGPAASPSLEVDMPAPEFVARLTPGRGGLPPLTAYNTPHEYCYLQAALPQELANSQLRLQQLLDDVAGAGVLSATDAAAGQGQPQQEQQHEQDPQQQQQQHQEEEGAIKLNAPWSHAQQQLRVTQRPRLWVSPAGAVSPLHFDTSHSLLVQVSGFKRMLFFSPDQLHRLAPYPNTHLLRRRARVDVCVPDFARFPLLSGAGAMEVVLGPGDVVCFPSFWSHWTASLGQQREEAAVGCCMSVTFRCQAV